MQNIAKRLNEIKEDILKMGGGPHVRLLAVSKLQSIESIKEAYEAGQREFGENYVQELLQKAPQLPEDIQWTFIGHLQTNKCKNLLSLPNLKRINTIDSERIAAIVNQWCKKLNRSIEVLIQVHMTDEETKEGVQTNDVKNILLYIQSQCSYLQFRGLMVIGHTTNNDQTAKCFKEVSELKKKMLNNMLSCGCFYICPETSHIGNNGLNVPLNDETFELSMGMSNDIEVALLYGTSETRFVHNFKRKKVLKSPIQGLSKYKEIMEYQDHPLRKRTDIKDDLELWNYSKTCSPKISSKDIPVLQQSPRSKDWPLKNIAIYSGNFSELSDCRYISNPEIDLLKDDEKISIQLNEMLNRAALNGHNVAIALNKMAHTDKHQNKIKTILKIVKKWLIQPWDTSQMTSKESSISHESESTNHFISDKTTSINIGNCSKDILPHWHTKSKNHNGKKYKIVIIFTVDSNRDWIHIRNIALPIFSEPRPPPFVKAQVIKPPSYIENNKSNVRSSSIFLTSGPDIIQKLEEKEKRNQEKKFRVKKKDKFNSSYKKLPQPTIYNP